MRHKAVLFDQLRRENRSKGRLVEWIESRLTFRFSNRLWKIALVALDSGTSNAFETNHTELLRDIRRLKEALNR